MTTVAYKDGIMASDSQVTDNGVKDFHTNKLLRLDDGTLVGYCGNYLDLVSLKEKIEGALSKKVSKKDLQGITFMVVTKHTLSTLQGGGLINMDTQPYAIGSGALYARAAMKAGASAEDAVRVAIEMDIYSGGEIHTLKL
jgi:ATP-dependent protease HslVU (ClpYQ) peptidase subunit